MRSASSVIGRAFSAQAVTSSSVDCPSSPPRRAPAALPPSCSPGREERRGPLRRRQAAPRRQHRARPAFRYAELVLELEDDALRRLLADAGDRRDVRRVLSGHSRGVIVRANADRSASATLGPTPEMPMSSMNTSRSARFGETVQLQRVLADVQIREDLTGVRRRRGRRASTVRRGSRSSRTPRIPRR